jgi:hypothetical protein
MNTSKVAILLASTLLAWAALPAPGHAGGTPATGATTDQLVMMGGADAPKSSGDSISAADGLNTAYRFFIEVPPNQTDLEVDLFDADVLANASDELQERDRARGNERTSVRYQLFDPAGNLVASRYNYGDDNNPANSHGVWKKLYDNETAGITGGDTFLDQFTTRAYNNDDGSQSFAASWTETNDLGGGGATGGDVQVTTGGALRIANSSDPSPFTNQPSIHREVDLSAYSAALVTFSYASGSGVDALVAPASSGDSIAFEASSNGGTSYTVLEEFADISGATTGSRSYDVTDFIASNTRFRFRITMRYAAANEYFEVDDFQVRGTTTQNGPDPAAGHWLLRVDMSNAVNADQDRLASLRDDVNGFGLRAHDGDSGSSGQELNVYAESFYIAGINRNNSLRDYLLYPWVNAGCSLAQHDFDFDADLPPEGGGNPNVSPYGDWNLTSRSGSFNAASTSMSNNDSWRTQTLTTWTSFSQAIDYGIWTYDLQIEDNGPGNYAPIYFTYDRDGGEPPPTSNPENGAFRVYLPTDAGAAPAKPYLQQRLTHVAQNGPNPPQIGLTTRFAITLSAINPSGSIGAITFSASNLVTAQIPGGEVVYAGTEFLSQGTLVSQPSIGGSGNLTWNPGSLAAGTTATLVYLIDVTPAAATDILATGAFDSGNGTRATYLDETGNSTQSRATVSIGELCELTVDADSPTPALFTSFAARRPRGGEGALLEWHTAAEAGTLSFDLYRLEGQDGERRVKLNDLPLLALVDAPQGGTYRFLDRGGDSAGAASYALVENDSRGGRNFYGPFRTAAANGTAAAAPEGGYSRVAGQPAALDAARRRDARGAAAPEPAAGIPLRSERGPASAAYKLKIAETGFYQLPASQLAGLFGLTLAEARQRLAAGGFDLRRSDRQVAWQAWNDGIAFWGEPPATPFYRESVYWLRLGQGLQIANRRGSDPPPSGASSTSRETLAIEKDVRPLVLMSLDPDGDFYFWDFLSPGGAAASRSFELSLPAVSPAAGAAEIAIDLQGAAEGSHQLAASVNGTPLGELAVAGRGRSATAIAVPAGVLHSGANTLALQSLAGGLVFVDHFSVAYDRDLRAAGDYLEARFGSTTFASIGQFQSPEAAIFDLADPDRPVKLARAKTRGELGGGYRLDFQNGAAGTRFVALAASALRPVASPELDLPSSLRSPAGAADYLVIAPAALAMPAQAIAEYRRGRGLSAQPVSLTDIYDEFAAGHADPRAIGAFLAYALGRWQQPPRYVLLAGAGSYDWRDVQGYGDNLLPMLMVDRGGSLFPSDARYADAFGGDGVPELAIGRVPALSAAELEDYLAKLEAYENDGASWTGKVLLLADGADSRFDFAAESRQLAELLPAGFDSQVLALAEQGSLAAARTQLLGALGEGRAWLGYVGHGGVDRLSPQGLLTKADVPALGNEGKPFVLQTISCHVALHGLPGFDALGEDLVIDPAGGAVAVFAPAWLSEHDQAKQLGDRLLRQVFQLKVPRLGDAIREAMRSAAENGVPKNLLDAYQLLGDPALELRLEPEPATQAPCESDCGQG